MPSLQRGQVYKLASGWVIRYYENGQRHQRNGFETKSAAALALAEALNTPQAHRDLTVQELVDEYLAQHIAEPSTIATLGYSLKHVTAAFGDVRVELLRVAELRGWRKRLPAGSAWHIVKALRQVLNYAVECEYVAENIGAQGSEPRTAAKGDRHLRRLGRDRGGRHRARLAASDHRHRHRPALRGMARARAS
jgi:hypothetical protein